MAPPPYHDDQPEDSPYNTHRDHNPKTECSLIDRWWIEDRKSGVGFVRPDVHFESTHPSLRTLPGEEKSWKDIQANMRGQDREDFLQDLLEKFLPKGTEAAAVGIEDVMERERDLFISIDDDLQKVELSELERKVVTEALPWVVEYIEERKRIHRHMLDTFLRRAEKNLRMRMMGLDHDFFEEPGEEEAGDVAGVLFRNIGLAKSLAAATPRRDKSAEPELDLTPEKKMQDRIRKRPEAANQARSKALHHLLSRLVRKMEQDDEGNIVAVPTRDQVRDLSVFEGSLLQMARQRMTIHLSQNGHIPRAVVEQMFVDVMAVGSSVDPATGSVVMQQVGRKTAYKKSSTFKAWMRPKYEKPDELDSCSFTPRIGRAPRTNMYRSKSARGLRHELTSWQQKEQLEMQECTFQPNIHKGLRPSKSHTSFPQHRPFRRDQLGCLRGESLKAPVAQGDGTRHLPGGCSFLWSLRSRSAEPAWRAKPGAPTAEKEAMQFGECFPSSESQHEERRMRDWNAHVRLQCDQLEMVRKPDGDRSVLLFANRFLELRASEKAKREHLRREVAANLGFRRKSI